MKTSQYNYYVPYEGKVIIFNGLTKNLFTVSAANADNFRKIIEHPDIYLYRFGDFIGKMRSCGFILDDGTDEYALMMSYYRRGLWPDYYRLMILPTYRCNLDCWYCVQSHLSIDLSDEHVSRIKKHLRKYLSENGIKTFYLTWFGGEPLIRYDIIKDVTSHAVAVCSELGVKMSAGITTNSLLLTPSRIKELSSLGVKFYQITIDGNRQEHNRVKCLPHADTFERALRNISDIVRLIPDSTVNLRINYSGKTLSPSDILGDINALIPQELRRRIEVSPKKIWQENESSINQGKLLEFTDLIRSSGYKAETTEYGVCYVDYVHNTTVFPNGRVDICNLDNETGRATLSEEGDVVWEQEDMCRSYSADKENIICNRCKHFPLCCGPCPVRRNSMMKEHNTVTCLFKDSSDSDSKMALEVIKYYKEMTPQALQS